MKQEKQKGWEDLLSEPQIEKYSNAIRQGYFDDYHGNEWRHTFYGAWIWKHPNRVKAVSRFRDLVGHLPQWEDVTEDNLCAKLREDHLRRALGDNQRARRQEHTA